MSDSVSDVRRRAFLQLLGSAAAATIVGLPEDARAAGDLPVSPHPTPGSFYEIPPATDFVEYTLRLSRAGHNLGTPGTIPMHPTAFRLLAPVGRTCRATILPALPDTQRTHVVGVIGFNRRSEVSITKMGKMGKMPPFDAAVFGTLECYVPVNLSTEEDTPLVIEFGTMGAIQGHLMLVLLHTTEDPRAWLATADPMFGDVELDWDVGLGPFRHSDEG